MLESTKIALVRLVFAVLGLVFVGLCLIAASQANFLTSFGEVMADPWGLAAIVDLYVGFALFSAFLLLLDGVKPVSFVWIVLLFCVGNAVSVVWIILRLPKLAAKLRP